MLFSSMLFLWIFLPICYFLYILINPKYKNTFLLLMSLTFYAWGEPKYILLMMISIIINYGIALLMDKSSHRKIWLICDIIFNIGLLFYFKYFGTIYGYIEQFFGIRGVNVSLPELIIKLPLGISFYTFQVMSYVIDLYQGKIKVQRNMIDLALYISFFPQLIAGPIVRYADIEEQIKFREENWHKAAIGIKRFIYGLSKKVIISNTLAQAADTIFSLGYSNVRTSMLWLGMIFYTFQIYYDFSGYSDMAIGLGQIFGFDFIENFNYPYISKSITEFWRRWHISLSTWFREYIYFPLGGSRCSKWKNYRNLLIVFCITGIWHGATLNFWIWGIYYGIIILVEKSFLGKYLDNNKIKVINSIYTMTIVIVGWALFRCDSLKDAMELVIHLFSYNDLSIYCWYDLISVRQIFVLIVGILFSGVIQERLTKIKSVLYGDKLYYSELIVQLGLLFICIMLLVSGQYNPFIYFRF